MAQESPIDSLGPPDFGFACEFRDGFAHIEMWNVTSEAVWEINIFTPNTQWRFDGGGAQCQGERMLEDIAKAPITIRQLFVGCIVKLLGWAVKKLTPDQRQDSLERLAKTQRRLAPARLGIDLQGRIIRVVFGPASPEEAAIWRKVFEILIGGQRQ